MLHDERWDLDEDGKVIWDVANYIEEHGWIQCSYNRKSEGVCILGAYHALTGNEDHSSISKIANFLDTEHLKGDCFVITDYNDTPGRTKEEVIAMLKQAARSK